MNKKTKKLILICGIPAAVFALLVLAAATPHAGKEAILRAQKVKANAVCMELEQAVLRFYDDNGTLPANVIKDARFSSTSEQGLNMLLVLTNIEVGGDPLNSKGIRYLNLDPRRTGHSNGLVLNPEGDFLGLHDPWGRPYMIALDGDFDESISVLPKAQKEPRKLQRRVAVWSDGKDPDDPKDDVITW